MVLALKVGEATNSGKVEVEQNWDEKAMHWGRKKKNELSNEMRKGNSVLNLHCRNNFEREIS